jgi:glycerophosphoryl diester phosphodiesterase
MPAVRRVGHQGAGHLAPGNTVASFEAALRAGVDVIEFDVLPERADGTGALVLAHDPDEVRARRAEGTLLTLDEGLDWLCATGLGLLVDLKLPGYEDRVAAALCERGAVERALVSTMERRSLERLRAIAPELRLGWSVPRVRRDPFASPLTAVPARAGVRVLRRALPGRAARAIRERRCDAIMANHRVVTGELVRAVRAAGGEVYAWTVDARERIGALAALGVTGIITNDPRLFAPDAVASPAAAVAARPAAPPAGREPDRPDRA